MNRLRQYLRTAQGRTVSDPPDDPVTALRAAAAELDVAYSAIHARISREYPGTDPYTVYGVADGRPILLDAAAARVTARAALVLAEAARL